MPTLLQINVTANWGSHGRIAEQIGSMAIDRGWKSYIAYSRFAPESRSGLIRIGWPYDKYLHAAATRLFDRHGLASAAATRSLIEKIRRIRPDIIHLHIIHGYYLNYPILFDFLKQWGGPVVWTMHDCWAFTGHCPYFTYAGCHKWKTGCHDCPQKRVYPQSLFADRSHLNYIRKKQSFTSMPRLTIVPVSAWLASELRESFLAYADIRVIHNGIDIDTFRPSIHATRGTVLGVASRWDGRKGLEEFIKLREYLPADINIFLVGLDKKQIRRLPKGIQGIARTESTAQLVELYNSADVFVNPSHEDTYPTTNLEAMACGTPVVAYDTTGTAEAISPGTGYAVPPSDTRALAQAILKARSLPRDVIRRHAVDQFDKNKTWAAYFDLYQSILK